MLFLSRLTAFARTCTSTAMAPDDHDIGLMLEAIQRSGVADSTVIIVVGDHGYWPGK